MAYQFKPSTASAWLEKVVGEFSYLGGTRYDFLFYQYEKRNPGFYCNYQRSGKVIKFTKIKMEDAGRNFGVIFPLRAAHHAAAARIHRKF